MDGKTRTRVEGDFHLEGSIFENIERKNLKAEGYEIHMGQSTLKEGAKRLLTVTDAVTGETKEDGAYKDNVFGSYIHGIFDGPEIAQTIVKILAERKGVDMGDLGTLSYAEYKETQYDLLAAGLREHLDMKKIYEILEEGIEG